MKRPLVALVQWTAPVTGCNSFLCINKREHSRKRGEGKIKIMTSRYKYLIISFQFKETF